MFGMGLLIRSEIVTPTCTRYSVKCSSDDSRAFLEAPHIQVDWTQYEFLAQ